MREARFQCRQLFAQFLDLLLHLNDVAMNLSYVGDRIRVLIHRRHRRFLDERYTNLGGT